MAWSQNISLPLLLLLWAGELQMIDGCHPTSKELHICLNIYLERDFPFVDTIIKGQQNPLYGGRRVLLEGPDLQSICQQIVALHDCYAGLLKECGTYWQLDRYQRLMDTIENMYFYLCGNSTNNVRDLLLNGDCLKRASRYLEDCSVSGNNWFTTWKEILRMQVDAGDRCTFLYDYKTCLVENVKKVSCGRKASQVYGQVMEVWLSAWCESNAMIHVSSTSCLRSSSILIVIVTLGLAEAVRSLV